MAELIFPTGFDEKTTIAQDDMILMADSEDDNKIKKAKYSNLKGEKGDPGQNGQDGQDGKDGADGQDGQDGTDGASIVSGGFVGDDLVFSKDDGTDVTIENAKTTLQGPEGEEGPEGPEGPEGNGIESVTATKVGKITTVTITETDGTETSFQVADGQDGQGAGDVVGPNSSTDEDIALFDGVDGKHIKDGSKKLSDFVQTSGNQTVNGVKTFTSEPVLPSKTTDATNDGTKPATEAQVYNVANGLGTAASKNTGTSSGNVPVIGSNGKLDTSIVPDVHTDAVTSVNGNTGAVTGLQTTANLKTDLTDNSDSYYPSQKAVKTAVDAKQDTIDSSHKLSADNISNGTNNRVCIVASSAPSTPSEGDLWYDTANDVLKSYNGTSWDEAGGGSGITQIFTLSSTSDLVNAQAAYDWITSNNIAYVRLSGTSQLYRCYGCSYGSTFTGNISFQNVYPGWNSYNFNINKINLSAIMFQVSSGTVTSVTQLTTLSQYVVSSLPSTPTTNTIYFVTD